MGERRMVRIKRTLCCIVGVGVLSSYTVTATAADHVGGEAQSASSSHQPVQRCMSGFWQVSGTSSCLKVGGFARYVLGLQGDGFGSVKSYGANALIRPSSNEKGATNLWQTALARVNFDIRSQTSYGLVRGFMEFEAKDNESNTGGPLNLRHAYAQFGSFLFGKTDSVWIHGDSSPGLASTTSLQGDVGARVVQARYTLPLSGGLSFAIAFEDQAKHDKLAVSKIRSSTGAVPPADIKNVEHLANDIPAVAVAIKAKRESVSAQLSGIFARHKVELKNDLLGSKPVDKTVDGWGVMGGVKLDMGGNDDTLAARVYYTRGLASNYTESVYPNKPYSFLWSGTPTEAKVKKVDVLGALAWFRHGWSDQWNSTVGAGYTQVRNQAELEAYPESGLSVFMNNSFDVAEQLNVALEVMYSRKVWDPNDDDDKKHAFSSALQITRFF